MLLQCAENPDVRAKLFFGNLRPRPLSCSRPLYKTRESRYVVTSMLLQCAENPDVRAKLFFGNLRPRPH